MTIAKLLQWVSNRYLAKSKKGDDEIKARLLWRDENNKPVKVKYANFGYNSGLTNLLTIEMSTATDQGLGFEDLLINNFEKGQENG